jgi:hypothetical protein
MLDDQKVALDDPQVADFNSIPEANPGVCLDSAAMARRLRRSLTGRASGSATPNAAIREMMDASKAILPFKKSCFVTGILNFRAW